MGEFTPIDACSNLYLLISRVSDETRKPNRARPRDEGSQLNNLPCGKSCHLNAMLPKSFHTRCNKFPCSLSFSQSRLALDQGAYDVFLSFRGEDNRKSFTDENEIPRGEELSKHLLKAIQESKISIVIFSKGYASTRWCLNELVEILECKNRKTGQIVLPIFYDIDPSDVRKQTGSFAKAFDKHEECFKEKVKEWRKALEEAGNLSNLNDMENRHESKLIQAIIKDVLNKLDPKYINVATNLVGIDPLVQTIRDFLSTATDEVCMVGIHGMPGIGKTTIAKVIFNQLCYGFEGMVLIKERLCHKRVIVVVDDVAQQCQQNALVGERSWFGPGSRVIITTNDERLLLKVDRKFKVEELKRDASLQLFSWHAFRDNKPSKDYVELLNDVVDYCGGIPLALEVLARCGYNPEDDLELLGKSLIKINASGEISMHNLLRDMGREIIHKSHLTTWKTQSNLAMIIHKDEMLEVTPNQWSTSLWTFKLLSEELIWICWLECPLKSFPSDFMLDKLVVLEMQYSNIKELWKEKKILNKLKILNLSYSKYLVKTPNLNSSSLEKLLLEGCLSLVEVHQSVGHLKSLIFLNLKGCRRLKTLPQSICDAKSLEILNISECSQLEKLPEHIGGMESLTKLLADGINNEQFLASIEHLKYLRKLSMCGYNSNVDAASSTSWPSPISSWISASVLDWKALLPTCFTSWRLLRKLRLSYYGLSERTINCVDLGGLVYLEELNLSGNNFSSLPSSISVLPKLQLLRVSHCRNLVSISELPSSLKFLDAIGCKSMERVRLPIQSKNNSNLSLYRCPSNHGWIISSDTACDLSNNNTSLVEASYNRCYGYHIDDYDASLLMSRVCRKFPNGFGYRAEGCSLSFHIPQVFQGLVFWAFSTRMYFSSSHTIKAIIRKKSNGMQLFEATQVVGLYCPLSWVRYVSLSEMAMEEYCGHEELELYVNLGSEDINVKQCGIHVVVDWDSFRAIEWDPDIERGNVTSPTSHLLDHPLYGSIAFTTMEKWKAKLPLLG
uniref:TIR domain-containing protein n=1 Tax=Salix viminalis TaxID=40686 RepID=A0A6N2LWN3_SALVM